MTSNLSNDADNNANTIWIRLVAATRLSYCYFDDISIHGTPITLPPTQTPTLTPTESTKAPTSSTSFPTSNTLSPTTSTVEPTSITAFPTSNTISPTTNPTIYPTKMATNLPPSEDNSGRSPIKIPLTTVYIFMAGLACVCCTILIYVVAYYRFKSNPKPSKKNTINIQLSVNHDLDPKTELVHNKSSPNPVILHVQATRPTPGQTHTITTFPESTSNPALTGQKPLNVTIHETNPNNALPEQPSPKEIITKGITDIDSSVSEGIGNEGIKTNN